VLDGDLDEFVEASLKAGLAVGSKRVDAWSTCLRGYHRPRAWRRGRL